MEYANLGTSGLTVSRLGLGTDQFGTRVDLSAARKIVHAALDAGINFVDTAHIYSGTALLPFYPLAGGLLAGRYRRGARPGPDTRAGRLDWARKFHSYYATNANFDLMERLGAFARRRGRTLAELALAWLLNRPAVCAVIVGASSPEHVLANGKASGWRLSGEELREIGIILGDADTYLGYPQHLWWEVGPERSQGSRGQT